MSFQDKLKSAHKEMDEAGIKKSNYNSPILVLFRKLGLNIKPLQYYSFSQSFLITAVWFGIVWGLLMWFTTWQSSNMSGRLALAASICAGVLFGLFMAFYYQRCSKKHNLSKWEQL